MVGWSGLDWTGLSCRMGPGCIFEVLDVALGKWSRSFLVDLVTISTFLRTSGGVLLHMYGAALFECFELHEIRT